MDGWVDGQILWMHGWVDEYCRWMDTVDHQKDEQILQMDRWTGGLIKTMDGWVDEKILSIDDTMDGYIDIVHVLIGTIDRCR